MIAAEIEKEPSDQYGYAAKYHQVMGPGEYLTACTLSALRLLDGVDITASFLVSSSATIPAGVAVAGSTTTIQDDTDLNVLGFRVGDHVVNQTRGYTTQVKKIFYTAIKNDTLQIGQQSVACGVGDVFSSAKAVATIRAGADGNRVKLVFNATTNLSNVFQDEVIINVKDY